MSSFSGIFRNKGRLQPLPTGPIADAFREYINNEIPARFIDTSTLQFISRKNVFGVFQNEIANVTERHVQARIESLQSDPLASYQPRREMVIRDIIQDVVKYVIFSHRWDEKAGEPKYQDVFAGKRYISKFKKLAQFCETSSRLGQKLVWVDTCCIDQRDAAELGEAIQSMYKWYANSYLCIVHLAESTSYADWARDSWFTRGWTLQELLAPRRIKFYNKAWHPFTPPPTYDDRKVEDVTLLLENVTCIPKSVLTADNSHGVRGYSFWEIMSWASKRQTTRIEDRAYSLVGLLRVSLSIAYGEGERAFSRLIVTVAANKPSWDIFAWFGQPSLDYFSLPSSPASYPKFEAGLGKDRVGVREFTITTHEVSMKAFPPISMALFSVVEPKEPAKPFLVTLKQRPEGEASLGRYSDIVVECGANRFKTIRDAHRLSACIINHHATSRVREQGKLMVGGEYICFLLYSEHGVDDETTWMKLATDNLLRISFLGMPATVRRDSGVRQLSFVDDDRPAATNGFVTPLAMTFIQSPLTAK